VSLTHTSIPISPRIGRFSYAIRNIVVEAHRVEAAGTRVRYMNVGDPIAAGFKTPQHLIDAVERALRDGHNGYLMEAGNVMSLVDALRRLLVSESERAAMGRNGLEIIRDWSYERCRLGVVAATENLNVAK
jgi:hypothetical protein